MKEYVLSIDCGTQSIRALIFDEIGSLVTKEQVKFVPYVSPQAEWAEQDTAVYWDAICEACNNTKKNYPEYFNKIKAVSLAAQRDTVVLLDKDKNPLYPAIVWMDQRKTKKRKPLSPLNSLLVSVIGQNEVVDMVSTSCHAHWMEEYRPKLWAKTDKYVLLSSYFNYKMCNKLIDNRANQVGHIPFNYKKGVWEKKGALKDEFFQIDRDKLVELDDPVKILGQVSKEAAEQTGLPEGLAYIAAGTDKACETVGVGCLDNSCASISLGSQASVQTTSKRYYEALPLIPPFPSAIANTYNPEIQIYRGYWMISWFKDQFAKEEVAEALIKNVIPEDLLNEKLEEVPPGCDGLLLQPYWGSGIKSPEARGAIIGFSDVHTRIHIYRAIIEGIGLGLLEGIHTIEKKSKIKMERVMLSGGGSRSDAIAQISADIFNRPVQRVQTYETSGLGAAIVAFVALGKYDSFEEAVDKMVHVKDEFLPIKKHVETYEKIYDKVYKHVYKRLKPLYKKMKHEL